MRTEHHFFSYASSRLTREHVCSSAFTTTTAIADDAHISSTYFSAA